jgi:ADP-heptose:LPS heptosyltransferase
MKILVIRFSSIGDVIWVTPVLRCLKAQIPNAEVHFCTKSAYAEMFECNPNVDKIHLLSPQKTLSELASELQKEKFDVVIDLHKNPRSWFLKWKLGVKSYTYPKLTFQKWLYVSLKIDKLPKNHVADRYLETVKPLGVTPDGKGLDFIIPQKSKIPIQYFPQTHQNGFVALVIGASYFTKRLPVYKIIELCESLKQPIVLVGGKEDKEAADQIYKYFAIQYPENNPIFDTCGQLTIAQSASVVEQANVVFGHDTGLTHIAACFQKTIFSIWGGTVPELGLYPYQTPYFVLEKKGLPCRPCSRMGKRACPQGHFACMKTQDFEKIDEKIVDFF